jgi:hypothetical protein
VEGAAQLIAPAMPAESFFSACIAITKGIPLSISIAILGASGYVGSALCAHILSFGILEPEDRIQLVGHGEPASQGRLLAIRADLLECL